MSLWPHGLQHTRLPCPSLSPRVCSNSCPLSLWCHPTVLSSISPFSCPQSFPGSGSFPVTWLFASGGQNIGASVSASPSNEYSGLISFRIDWFDFLTVQGTLKSLLQHHSSKKHQFFDAQPSLWSNSHICTWVLEKPQLWLYGPLLTKRCLYFLIYSRLICRTLGQECKETLCLPKAETCVFTVVVWTSFYCKVWTGIWLGIYWEFKIIKNYHNLKNIIHIQSSDIIIIKWIELRICHAMAIKLESSGLYFLFPI